MQPYFFPYLGHFALIANVDRWVVFDVTQYTPKTWMNRNRILHPKHGSMYVTLPLAGSSQNSLIKDVCVLNPASSFASIKGKLSHYRKNAPHYATVVELVDRSFGGVSSRSLVALNVAGLKDVCGYLGIRFEYSICSEMDLDLSGVEHPGQWALAISRQLGADAYINPLGGAELFRPGEFADAGIRLSFLTMPPLIYETGPYEFVPNLSILDVLMWNTPDTVMTAISATSSITAASGD